MHGMMGGFGAGSGMGGFGAIFMIALWVIVIVGIVFLIKWFMVSTKTANKSSAFEETPLVILKKRYARGEIDEAEFEVKKKVLEG